MLTFLGKGNAFDVNYGNTSAFYKSGNVFYLFDCGEDVFGKLIKNDLLLNIKKIIIFITHLHSDHVGSLSTLLYYFKYVNKTCDVSIIYPNKAYLSDFLSYMGNDIKNIIKTPLDYTELNIQIVEQEHIPYSYGYFVKLNDKKIFYSGDTHIVHPLAIKRLREGELDYFFQEVLSVDLEKHTYIRNLEEKIIPELRKKVYCMHLDKIAEVEAKEMGFNIVTLFKK